MIRSGKIICARGIGSFSQSVYKQVMVSQSENRFANIALEDWVCRNLDLSTKNVLILSKNKAITSAPSNITATFLGKEIVYPAGYPEQLVYSNLPSSLSLYSLPRPPVSPEQQEEGRYSFSVTLELTDDTGHKSVMEALQKIGNKYLEQKPHSDSAVGRLSLVRPDDGWFPGIGEIQSDLEVVLQQIELNKKKEVVKKIERKGAKTRFKIANSFGI